MNQNDKIRNSLCGEGCTNKAIYFFNLGRDNEDLIVKFCRVHKDCENYRYAKRHGKKLKSLEAKG